MNNEPRLTASLLSACPPDDAQQRRLEEELAKKYREQSEDQQNEGLAKPRVNTDFDVLKKHLSATFNVPVKFTCNDAGKGSISFQFRNEDELMRLISAFDTIKAQRN